MTLHKGTWEMITAIVCLLSGVWSISWCAALGATLLDGVGPHTVAVDWKKWVGTILIGVVVFIFGIELFHRAEDLSRVRVKVETEIQK